MSIHEFNDMIEVDTPHGRGRAIFVEASARDNYWTVQLQSGAIVTYPQKKIKGVRNYTSSLGLTDEQMGIIVA